MAIQSPTVVFDRKGRHRRFRGGGIITGRLGFPAGSGRYFTSQIEAQFRRRCTIQADANIDTGGYNVQWTRSTTKGAGMLGLFGAASNAVSGLAICELAAAASGTFIATGSL